MDFPPQASTTVTTRAAASARRETALTAAAAGLVVLFGASLLLLDRNFYWIDDAQSGALPAYCEMNRALRSGELPLLSRSSWRAGALAAEFPTGVFSPSLDLSILLAFGLGLSLPLTSAVLSLIHLGVLAAGVFRLARQRGLPVHLALLATLVASINGWIILWGARTWQVCLFSFAWLPWYWWALERTRAGRGGRLAFAPAGIFLFLIITAGWPFTIAMAALLTLWVMTRTWIERRSLWATWPAFAAWAVGLGLSAPAWLMVLEFIPYSDRARSGAVAWASPTWIVPFDALPGLILPNVVAQWFVFTAPRAHASAELAGGLVPVVVLAACLWRWGRAAFRALRWEWGLCAVGLVLATCPSPAKFAHSFRWLPLFFMALGLLAAHALAWARARAAVAVPGDGAAPPAAGNLPNLGRVALFLVLCVWAREIFMPPWVDTRLFMSGAILALVAFLWAYVEDRFAADSPARAWAPCAVMLASCWIAFASCRTLSDLPRWDLGEQVRQPGPLDPSVRYLSVLAWDDMVDFDEDRTHERWRGTGAELYCGNLGSYAGLDFVNGYSGMKPLGLQEIFKWEVHGCFEEPADAKRVLSTESGPDGLLRRMGVDGLVVADRFNACTPTLLAHGWQEATRVKGGRVFRRTGPASPRAYAVAAAEPVTDHVAAVEELLTHGTAPTPSLLTPAPGKTAEERKFAPAQVTVVEERRTSMTVDVASAPGDGEILVVFARPWFPGYRAMCDGRPVPVETYDLCMPAMRLPAGTNGRVVLEYWPASLTLGFWLAGTTAAALTLAVLWEFARRRRRATVEATAPARRAAPESVEQLA